LSQQGDTSFRFDSPAKVGPPVAQQTVYTLTALAPGTTTLAASAYGERNCGDGWQWTYVNGAATLLTVTTAPTRLGDGNGDQVVDMADLNACVQEIFDGDGAFWQDAPGSGYPGATGCDANQDTLIDAGDLSCTALLIANGVEGCSADAVQQAGQTSAKLTIAQDRTAVAGETVQVPITLTTDSAAVTAAAFRLHFDAARLTFDPTDGNGDAIPDALHFTLPALTEQPLITVTTHTGALDIAFTALAATPVTWYDGVLLTVTLRANALSGGSPVTTTLAFDPSVPPSLGSATGTSIPVQTADGLVQILPPAAAVRLYLPLITQE